MNGRNKKLLYGIIGTFMFNSSVRAMEGKENDNKGIVSSITSAFFSKKGLAASTFAGLGLGWWASSDEQKEKVEEFKDAALDFASENKLAVGAGAVTLAGLAYMVNKYTASPQKAPEIKTEETKQPAGNELPGQRSTDANAFPQQAGGGLPLVRENNLLSSAFSDFMELVKKLYDQNREKDQITGLTNLFLGKPYMLFFYSDLIERVALSGKGAEKSLGDILAQIYQGHPENLFCDNNFLVECFTALENEDLSNKVGYLFTLLVNYCIENPHELLNDRQFMNNRASHTGLQAVPFYTFLTVALGLRERAYVQDIFEMLQEAERFDIIKKYQSSGNVRLQTLMKDTDIQSLEGCFYWAGECQLQLEAMQKATQEFEGQFIKPYLPQQRY